MGPATVSQGGVSPPRLWTVSTRIMEHEMHELVLSCTRARRQMLEMMPAGKPVLH